MPDTSVAASIARAALGEDVRSVTRFPTGLAHWVYDVMLSSGRNVVVRVSSPGNRDELAGGLYWQQRLRPAGVRVAKILQADLDAGFPYMILERLPGTDLGNVYDDLTRRQRAQISSLIVEMQRRTALLSEADGFGYALSYDEALESSWSDVLAASLTRARSWIAIAGVVDPVWSDQLAERLDEAGDDFQDVRPKAFLHDATTKNVIVNEGKFSGIVDVDSMAFGDPLWTTALTRMSLLASKRPTDYVDAQLAELDPEARHMKRFDLYTALHGLSFLGELGQAFNKGVAPLVDAEYRQHLEAVLEALL